jgi:hypothetical protein
MNDAAWPTKALLFDNSEVAFGGLAKCLPADAHAPGSKTAAFCKG